MSDADFEADVATVHTANLAFWPRLQDKSDRMWRHIVSQLTSRKRAEGHKGPLFPADVPYVAGMAELAEDLPRVYEEFKTAQTSHIMGDKDATNALARWALENGPSLLHSANQVLTGINSALEYRAISEDVSS